MDKVREEENTIRTYGILIILALVWGSSFILIKRGLEAFPPDQLACIRVLFAFLTLSYPAFNNLKKIEPGKLKLVALSGITGIFIPTFLFSYAETSLDSSLTGVLNALSPLFTLLFAIILFKFKLHFRQAIGLFIGFAGSAGISFVGSEGSLGAINIYAFLVVVATICYGYNINLIKAHLSKIDALTLTAISLLVIAPFALVYLLTTDFISRVQAPGAMQSLGYISILGIFGTAGAIVLYTRLIQITTAVKASSVTYLIPIVAVFWGLFDGEQLFALHYVGMLLIIIGVYIVNRKAGKD